MHDHHRRGSRPHRTHSDNGRDTLVSSKPPPNITAMSALALSQPQYSVSVEPLGGSSGSESRADFGAHTDVVNPPAGQLSASQAMVVSDRIHVGTSSGAVYGGTGHTINIDSRTILPPVRPPPDSPGFVTFPIPRVEEARDESATESYARILLKKCIGYPLWSPGPITNPPEYREEGIRLGDVGIVNEFGLFEFSFNICLPADHPINVACGMPSSFRPFTYSPHQIARNDAFDSNTVIASASVRESSINSGAQNQSNPRQFHFDGSTPEGAILVLPNGSSRKDFLTNFRCQLLAHARKHALNWLEWVYGSLDLASSIYLITGTDKCDNWCLASYSNIPAEIGISLSFTPTVTRTNHPAGVVQYVAQSSGGITRRTFRPNEHDCGNQTVFIRGYKISACRTLQERVRLGAIKIQDVRSQQYENTTSLDAVSVAAIPSWILSQFTNFFRNGSTNQAVDSSDNAILQIESIPGPPKMNHPSDIINSYMLSADPRAQFAITHDDDWFSVIEESDDALPNGFELLQRILRKYAPVQDAGCVTLVQKEDRMDSSQSTNQSTYSSLGNSGAKSSLQVSEPTSPPQASNSSHLPSPEASHTVNEQPTTARVLAQRISNLRAGGYDCVDIRRSLSNYIQYRKLGFLIHEFSSSGPVHNPMWTAKHYLNGVVIGEATGRTRSDAEERAAEIGYRNVVALVASHR